MQALPAEPGPEGTDPWGGQGELVRDGLMLTDPIADMLTRIRNANRALQSAKPASAAARAASRSPGPA